jgi:centromeric protein E
MPLQNSMTGAGARIAIVCAITPAAAQAEETANTLKFATRAKLVR